MKMLNGCDLEKSNLLGLSHFVRFKGIIYLYKYCVHSFSLVIKY